MERLLRRERRSNSIMSIMKMSTAQTANAPRMANRKRLATYRRRVRGPSTASASGHGPRGRRDAAWPEPAQRCRYLLEAGSRCPRKPRLPARVHVPLRCDRPDEGGGEGHRIEQRSGGGAHDGGIGG